MDPDAMTAFFTVHSDLPREGPGDAADIAWAANVVGLAPTARILDAACGPGGDIEALLRAAPQGHVTAVDQHNPFVDAARVRWDHEPQTTFRVGDMTAVEGPFDFIWCAGAVYFLGIEAALAAWRRQLSPHGAIAFSEPCLFVKEPSEGALAFWQGYERLTDQAGIEHQIEKASYELLACRPLDATAWENYYRPLEARVARLRARADPTITRTLDETSREVERWRAHQAETGYLLCVVRPRSGR